MDPFEGLDGIATGDPSATWWLTETLFKLPGVGKMVPAAFPVYLEVELWPIGEGMPAVDLIYGILAGHTSTPGDSWHLVWNGMESPFEPLVPTAHAFFGEDVRQPARSYHVLRCSLEALPNLWHRSSSPNPNFSWPADRAWLVGGDVDYDQIFIGTSEACADELEGHAELKVRRVAHDFIPTGVL